MLYTAGSVQCAPGCTRVHQCGPVCSCTSVDQCLISEVSESHLPLPEACPNRPNPGDHCCCCLVFLSISTWTSKGIAMHWRALHRVENTVHSGAWHKKLYIHCTYYVNTFLLFKNNCALWLVAAIRSCPTCPNRPTTLSVFLLFKPGQGKLVAQLNDLGPSTLTISAPR